MAAALRVLAVASAAVVSLVFAGSAMAAFNSPRLVIDNPNEKVSGGGAVTITYRQAREDDALFRVRIFVPQGYTTSLVPQAGQNIGSVAAVINATQISQEALVPVTGAIVGDTYDATKYPTGAACVGDPGIDGVWRLELNAAGQSLVVPVYVQSVEGPQAAFASGLLTICLPSPYAEAGAARAALGAKLIEARMQVRNVFTNPTTPGAYRWRAVATPWTVNSGAPNAAGSVEVQAFDTIPVNLTVSTSVNHRRNLVTLRGTLQQNREPVVGRTVQITYRGKIVRTVRTNARGGFSAVIRARKGLNTFFFRSTGAALDLGAGSCTQTFAPVPCIATMSSSYAVNANRKVRVRVR
jgi:hypothetical protein